MPRVAPHPSQYSLVALFWQPQRKHCINGPLDSSGARLYLSDVITLYAHQFYAALRQETVSSRFDGGFFHAQNCRSGCYDLAPNQTRGIPIRAKASPQIEDKQSQTCHPGLSRQAFLIFFFALPGCRVFAGIFFSSRREFFAGAAKLFSLFWLRAGTDCWGGTRF